MIRQRDFFFSLTISLLHFIYLSAMFFSCTFYFRDFLFQVCVRCILRLFGIREPVKGFTSLSPSIFSDSVEAQPSKDGGVDSFIHGESNDKNDGETNKGRHPEPAICSTCLGILQMCKLNDTGIPVKKNNVNLLANMIVDAVKEEGHEIDSFSIEVSAPPVVLESDSSLL